MPKTTGKKTITTITNHINKINQGHFSKNGYPDKTATKHILKHLIKNPTRKKMVGGGTKTQMAHQIVQLTPCLNHNQISNCPKKGGLTKTALNQLADHLKNLCKCKQKNNNHKKTNKKPPKQKHKKIIEKIQKTLLNKNTKK